MSTATLLIEFFLALIVVSGSGYLLSALIGRLGATLSLTPAALGLAVALGADSPELASAISALIHGHGDVGVGVVVGSNVFNIAALLGVGALFAKQGITVGRAAAWFNGGASLLILLPTGALLLGWLAPPLTLLLVSLVFLPYAALCSVRPSWLTHRSLPGWLSGFVHEAMTEVESEERDDLPSEPKLQWQGAVALLGALLAVIAGSLWLVGRAILLAERWRLSGALLGTLVLAGLTGVPNLVAAIRLARRGRGGALLSEALNSNSLNLLFGLCLPAVFASGPKPSTLTLIALIWLGVTTVFGLALASRRSGLGRKGGAALILSYVAFALTAWAFGT